MNDINQHQINNAINAVLEEHVAATRSQRVTIRELILDALDGAGFEIVGKRQSARAQDYHKIDPGDYPGQDVFEIKDPVPGHE